MIDVKEALNLELLDDYIELKIISLNKEINEYNDLLKKYRLFVAQFNEEVSSLSDMLSKKIEGVHNMIDSFISSYESLSKKIEELENSILSHNEAFSGQMTGEIESKLLKKLNDELQKVKKNCYEIICTYIKEYDNCKKMIDKAISKLQRLASKDIKNINI